MVVLIQKDPRHNQISIFVENVLNIVRFMCVHFASCKSNHQRRHETEKPTPQPPGESMRS